MSKSSLLARFYPVITNNESKRKTAKKTPARPSNTKRKSWEFLEIVIKSLYDAVAASSV
jgi:hypothetical protein